MDFQESLDYLYGLQRFGVKLGLDNMRALRARLPEMQSSMPVVHVAGTNGKGSVSVFLAEMLKRSGFRVGLYTSPHLSSFAERIRIDGEPVEMAAIARLAERVRNVSEGIPVTFFEATTAMALLAFFDSGVDVAIVETGLGGRLDATNIVDPVLTLITPVSFDHAEHLGDTLTEIATEKAGIIKEGVPVVVGRQPVEASAVILDAAMEKAAPVESYGENYSWQGDHEQLSLTVGSHLITGLSCALPGVHQLDNLAQAAAGAMRLRQHGFVVTEKALIEAGRRVSWPGRLEWFEGNTVLLDVSHNLAGISCLASYLASKNISRVHLVAGLSGARDPEKVLMPLVKFAAAVYAVPVSYAQSASCEQVVAWAEREKLKAASYGTASDGLLAALAVATPQEPVVVCGSLYLVAELRDVLVEGKMSANL